MYLLILYSCNTESSSFLDVKKSIFTTYKAHPTPHGNYGTNSSIFFLFRVNSSNVLPSRSRVHLTLSSNSFLELLYFQLAVFQTSPLAPGRADEWMSGAVDCLEFLPDELVVEVSRGLAGCADDLAQCKRLLYQVLAKHYGQAQQPPLFSNHVFDIHSGISELLGELRR